MVRIGLLSDTHGFLDDAVFRHFRDCDEVWHAGDFGDMAVVKQLQDFKPLRGVWGNIDGPDIRALFPETLRFHCAEAEVLMTHIGGYPGRYAPAIKPQLVAHPPRIFITGHSHILKIMFDEQLRCLHLNPGAAGRQGWHKVRTLIRFCIDAGRPKDCEVIELGKK